MNCYEKLCFLLSFFSLDSLKTMWGMYTRKCTSTKTYHEIVYYYGTVKYRVRCPNRRTGWAGRLVKATSNCGDVTDTIVEYAGPNYDFHTIPTTPRLLGFAYVDLEFLDGRKVSVAYEQPIDLLAPKAVSTQEKSNENKTD